MIRNSIDTLASGVNQYMMGDKNVLVDKKSNISIGGESMNIH